MRFKVSHRLRATALWATRPTLQTPLDNLPTELREQIYQYVLQPRGLSVQSLVRGDHYEGPPSLFLVSKASYADARDYLLRLQTHTIYIGAWGGRLPCNEQNDTLADVRSRFEVLRMVVTSARRLRFSFYLGGARSEAVQYAVQTVLEWLNVLLKDRERPVQVLELYGCAFSSHCEDTHRYGDLRQDETDFGNTLLHKVATHFRYLRLDIIQLSQTAAGLREEHFCPVPVLCANRRRRKVSIVVSSPIYTGPIADSDVEDNATLEALLEVYSETAFREARLEVCRSKIWPDHYRCFYPRHNRIVCLRCYQRGFYYLFPKQYKRAERRIGKCESRRHI